MLILHAAWLSAGDPYAGRLLLWGEAPAERPPRRSRTAATRPRPHPFAADHDALREALRGEPDTDTLVEAPAPPPPARPPTVAEAAAAARRARGSATTTTIAAPADLPGVLSRLSERERQRARRAANVSRFALSEARRAAEAAKATEPVSTTTALAWLPTRAGLPVSSWEAGTQGEDGTPALAPWEIPALALDPAEAVRTLLSLAAADGRVQLGDDLRYFAAAGRFAVSLAARQRLLPVMLRQDSSLYGRWRAELEGDGDRERYQLLTRAMPPAARALTPLPPSTGRNGKAAQPAPPAAAPHLRAFLDAAVDGIARATLKSTTVPTPVRGGAAADTAPGAAWLEALRGQPKLKLRPNEAAALHPHYEAWARSAALERTGPVRLLLRLEPPAGALFAQPDGRDWALQFALQATDDLSLIVPADLLWRGGRDAKLLDRRFAGAQETFLAALGRAARLFPPIESGLHTSQPVDARLTTEEAYEFVREKALLLSAAGIGVQLPGIQARLGVRVRLNGRGTPGAPGKTTTTAGLTWDKLVDFDWEVAIGDQTLTREEFEQLARLKSPLVNVRGQWVEVKPEAVADALAFFKAAPGQEDGLDPWTALQLALAPDTVPGLPVQDVESDGWLDDVLGAIQGGGARDLLPEPPGFAGTLRPYQRAGVSWLATLRRNGLGACLADDMGLGKTAQVIALLMQSRAEGAAGPALVVCPTSVVSNWRREIERFAPDLRILVHHGAGRARDDVATIAGEHDVVLSTYTLLHRDEDALAKVQWSAIVLDEAQNIKNAATRAAQAARRLPADFRAALTGTPVENRLADLWSIFHFINPGYLGGAAEFRRRFANPIEKLEDATAAEQLKRLCAPFILRRMKSDKSIIADLPDKVERKTFCPLTREQATLYEAVVKEGLDEIEGAEGISRRGFILGTITRLKQVCNHPALLLKDASALPGRSGKLERLTELLEEALAVDDRALIFTQYAEMGKLLKSYLETRFGREALLLTGATPVAERERMVARFQNDARGPNIFILSVKAGGAGLNLQRANHVFHFDRWWNPAVENQATDRAFRIGQQRNVQVHKFICTGTFEEQLDALIERKLALSESITGTSESWITEMSTSELRSLFALRADAVAEG